MQRYLDQLNLDTRAACFTELYLNNIAGILTYSCFIWNSYSCARNAITIFLYKLLNKLILKYFNK